MEGYQGMIQHQSMYDRFLHMAESDSSQWKSTKLVYVNNS